MPTTTENPSNWWTAIDGTSLVAMAVAIVAAGASIYSARVSWKASRETVARDFLQTKISTLSGAVTLIHQLDLMTPFLTLGESLGARTPLPIIAAGDFFKAFSKLQADLCAIAIPVGHYLVPTRQISIGDLLSYGNKVQTAMITHILDVGDRIELSGMSRFMESMRSIRDDVSFQIQEELDDSVRALAKCAGITIPEPMPRLL